MREKQGDTPAHLAPPHNIVWRGLKIMKNKLGLSCAKISLASASYTKPSLYIVTSPSWSELGTAQPQLVNDYSSVEAELAKI